MSAKAEFLSLGKALDVVLPDRQLPSQAIKSEPFPYLSTQRKCGVFVRAFSQTGLRQTAAQRRMLKDLLKQEVDARRNK